jgi:Selenocysteine lyase
MLGPEGCGVLYVQRDVQDSIEPVEFGYTNIAGYSDYGARDMTLRPDAGRYECGTLNTVGCFGLRAALDFILEVEVDRIGPQVQGIADLMAEGVRGKGYQLLGERTAETGAGIVSFRKPEIDCRLIVRQLKDKGFIAAPRQGWVRASPHFYISPGDVEALVEALP